MVASFSPLASARASSGTTSSSMAPWPRPSPESSSRVSIKPRHSSLRCWRSPPASRATIIIMGTSTTLVGVLPNYQSVGIAAPVMLIALRMLQGLAIGGEYGGAVIYVAEHAPPSLRGRYTSWIQTTAPLALLLSLMVIMTCRAALGSASFESWGWRVPFLSSLV